MYYFKKILVSPDIFMLLIFSSVCVCVCVCVCVFRKYILRDLNNFNFLRNETEDGLSLSMFQVYTQKIVYSSCWSDFIFLNSY